MEATNEPNRVDEDQAGTWEHETTHALAVQACVGWLQNLAATYERLQGTGGACDHDDVRAATLRAAADQLPEAMQVAGILEILDNARTARGLVRFRCYPCPDCGCMTVDGHSISCPRWMLVLTGDPAKPGADRSVATVHQADERAVIADLPCGCIVTELRVGVRMTADQMNAEAYCMVCDQVLTGVDVVAVQR